MQYVKDLISNTIYKIISKIVVNRHKIGIDDMVSPYQTGFIPKRSIHENIVMTNEMVHSMNKLKGNKDFFAIKLDLSKAYDMSWSFIKKVMQQVGIPEKINQIILHCISTVKINVLWQGQKGTNNQKNTLKDLNRQVRSSSHNQVQVSQMLQAQHRNQNRKTTVRYTP
ncbi:unnamed protein product [Vicia faba]|uniref:Reverse transcriptase domain-containing protein n=1 Tax=Vicia faba TaxID=3906 RepID=A0AAV1AL58_VICFA|nr:unnamed protein product [Vicia faba]